jgi:cobalt-zinc-cadmium efflux system membrane fusion protein
VKRGDPLAELFSTELARAKNDYLAKKAQWENDHRFLELRKKLAESAAISQQVWLETQNEESKSKLALQVARDNLLMLGLDESAIARIAREEGESKARMTLRSRVDGTVEQVSTAIGDLSDPKSILMEIRRDPAP